jgi:DNA mismatch repair protein MutS
VRRETMRVLTPGTVLEDQFLSPERNNYLCALARAAGATALASADVSTAQTFVSVFANADELTAELTRLTPSEVVVRSEDDAQFVRGSYSQPCRVAVETAAAPSSPLPSLDFSREDRPAGEAALALLAGYLNRLKIDGTGAVARASVHDAGGTMLLDPATRRHLDLVSGSGENVKASLLGVLARTRTPMGGRLLAARLCAPLTDVRAIRARLDDVSDLRERDSARLELQEVLAGIGDVERIVQKVHARRASPRDVAALGRSLRAAGRLRSGLDRLEPMRFEGYEWLGRLDDVPARIGALIDAALVDDPPNALADGGAIRPEHSEALRELISLRDHARDRLLELEAATRARSGCKSLKIKYTQAFGYYFEIPRTQAKAVPDDFARRQSTVNAERFTNVELKELESSILSAKTRQLALERDLFEALARDVDEAAGELLHAAAAVAEIDFLCGLAQVAGERRFVRPEIVEERVLDVDAARHPIVEAFGDVDFVANDCRADDDQRFLLITGPNMGGKSTYLRQTALVSILAQMGSFVPARRARLGIVDRLFTRIGAGDDIAAGRSTFYVEMSEMALILRRCTARSLLLIDEVGRGTGTTDGLAIAQAICEHLLAKQGGMPTVLFATHFHELVALAASSPVVENLHVAVADEPAGPIFTHRVLHGASSRSYGIAVAKMAGLPPDVVDRALEIADELESRPTPRPRSPRRGRDASRGDDQLDLGV